MFLSEDDISKQGVSSIKKIEALQWWDFNLETSYFITKEVLIFINKKNEIKLIKCRFENSLESYSYEIKKEIAKRRIKNLTF
jgi:hypothetical protein